MHVKINYRGSNFYGTALGGYISLCARILILSLASGQIWACFFAVSNTENESHTQLDVPNEVYYDV